MLNKSLLLLLILIPSIAIAVCPSTIAEDWAKAVQGRDGKKQYELMCPDLQKMNHDNLQSSNWVTGVSSPQVKSFKIEKDKQTSNYLVKYEMIAGGKVMGSVTDELQITNGCISGFKYLSPAEVEPTK